jgi:predicted nucleotidyltransferase
MMDQGQVDAWLASFLAKLKDRFGDRLVWVGHHGSWGRQEARPESDIDCIVVLDRVEDTDLNTYRDVVSSMPNARTLGSGLLMSVAELREMPRFHLVQFFYGRRVLYGSLQGIVAPPDPEELVTDIRLKAFDNLHAARHYLLYPHDLPRAVHKLKYPFKNCFYALQSWLLLTRGKFIPLKNEILE